MSVRFAVVVAVGLALAALPGCLERQEKIKVHRDGSVELSVELSGDRSDMDVGDALPDERHGWAMEEWTSKDAGGKERFNRRGTMKIASGRALPESFADSSEPGYKTALRFPTEIKIEKRSDGTYYHFKRVYVARESARYDFYRKQLEEHGPLKELSGKNPDELTDEQRVTMLTALQTLEGLKRIEFVRAGAAALEEQWPQHYELLLRRAVERHFKDVDVTPLVELLNEEQSPDRDARINSFGERHIAQLRDRLGRELHELRVPRREVEIFFDAYDEEEARRAVTEDLADEVWKTEVTLPGELVAHNGDSVTDGAVQWEFPGQALMDRDVFLMATSRVGRGDAARDDR